MVNRKTLNRFFAGKATNQEVKQVLEWICSENFETDLEQQYDHYIRDNNDCPQWDEYNQLQKLKRKIDAKKNIEHYDQILNYAQQSKTWSQKYLYKIAATFLLLAVVGLGVFNFTKEQETEHSRIEVDLVVKSTTRGQKSTIFLEDGSRVILNSGSKITYPRKFNGDQRNLTLEGEAFFEVEPDPSRPFIVKTGDVITKAVGTSFNVNTNTSGNKVISLVSGKVIVQRTEAGSEGYLLNPGEQVSINMESFEISPFEPIEVISWKDGTLYFQKAQLDEIVERLENWYGVNIEVENMSNHTKHYSGKFHNQSLENVLKGMAFVHDFEYKISGEQVIINFN